MLIAMEHITKLHNDKVILKDASFAMEEKDKIGIIGINGTGKTTFLKIVLGIENYQEGKIIKKNGLRIQYLAQDPIFDKDQDVLSQALMNIQEKEKEIKTFEVKKILTQLGLDTFTKKVSILSGGQQKRLALACALISDCDLLILDEPTNHLDNEMITWLEGYLRKMNHAILMVTHDRYFLENVTNRLLEIDNGCIYMYEGNYESYLEGKAIRSEVNQANQKKIQQLYKKELAWMRAGVLARGTKSQSRIDRFQELREKRIKEQENHFSISSLTSRLGKKTIEIDNIKKRYENLLFHHFSYHFKQQDRIGIIGPNGCGKTTLLKCIYGSEIIDAGTIEKGETVKLAYFKQDEEDMDVNMRVFDYISESANMIETKNGSVSVKVMLERFLFPSTLQHTMIGRLSKGECRRLYLLKILMEAPNVLFLDEPTNNLDIQTLAILEDYLDDFNGIVVTVSHDRYFLDRVCDYLFVFHEDKTIHQVVGGYSDYLAKVTKTVKQPNEGGIKTQKVSLLPQFTSSEKKEFASIDETLEQIQQEIKQIEEMMNECGDDFNRISELVNQRSSLEIKLQEKEDRWLYLNELNQKILVAKKR